MILFNSYIQIIVKYFYFNFFYHYLFSKGRRSDHKGIDKAFFE